MKKKNKSLGVYLFFDKKLDDRKLDDGAIIKITEEINFYPGRYGQQIINSPNEFLLYKNGNTKRDIYISASIVDNEDDNFVRSKIASSDVLFAFFSDLNTIEHDYKQLSLQYKYLGKNIIPVFLQKYKVVNNPVNKNLGDVPLETLRLGKFDLNLQTNDTLKLIEKHVGLHIKESKKKTPRHC